MSVNNRETIVLPEIGASPGGSNIDQPYEASVSDAHSDSRADGPTMFGAWIDGHDTVHRGFRGERS
ncbi:hypothetical protein PILCRDRAFT_804914 [Piloderma croceum F 1598]|uniref:Uncharacterized protein n=1 Tax=Piloderma croceum (strain F 1598) TaxID=765440 RepID=A0A0C3ACN8_PILCF|nr:hypothetical protein PILCRDRAFT_804914 [Piloderma croceum F 1598]